LRMAARGVTTRHWWGRGLQQEAAFANCPREALPVTEALGAQTLGLPCSIDLGRREVNRACATLTDVLDVSNRLRTAQETTHVMDAIATARLA